MPSGMFVQPSLLQISRVKYVNDKLRCACAGERPLYQVLEQQQAQVGGNLMGSDHTYIIPGGKPGLGNKCAPSPCSCLPHPLNAAPLTGF